MKLAVRLGLLALTGGLAFWLWMVCFPSPEKVVLKKISQLAALANVGTGDSNLARAGKATQVIGDFANDGEIVVNVPGMVGTLSGRDEIHDLVMAGFVSVTSLKVQFLDATARIGADRHTARLNCTGRVSVGDAKDTEIQELRFQLRKIEGNWLITRVETVKTLQ